jgi:flagellar hook protein FlgE
MATDVSTIQSLKAVDAWIDVINANISGGVRTAFKASRLKFAGSNTDLVRAGTASSLPLQFPEPGLTTANTVIDFSQGSITASTENTHLAIQGEGFFMVCEPSAINASGDYATAAEIFLTRDGEFRTNQQGLLVNSQGLYLVIGAISVTNNFANVRAVYNDLDGSPTNAALINSAKLSDFIANNGYPTSASGGPFALPQNPRSIMTVPNGRQSLQYSRYGSTVFDIDFDLVAFGYNPSMRLVAGTTADATILSKSLEASNASMTQSVPELSLAQKLFSALTKVLQTKQTNVDGVLNLVR